MGLPSAKARSLGSLAGSTDNEPQPGRQSGSAVQSSARSPKPSSALSSAASDCHSSLTKPTKRDVSAPVASSISNVGTISISAPKETASALSSKMENSGLNCSASILLPAWFWPMMWTGMLPAYCLKKAAKTGITSLQVGQSSLIKQTSARSASGLETLSPSKFSSWYAGSEATSPSPVMG